MNIVYVGSSGSLSLVPLKKLLLNGIKISAIGIDKPILDMNLIANFNIVDETKNTVETLAHSHDIPVVNLNAFNADRTLELSYFKPDIIIVSCFASLLANDILALAKIACINIHPSLLPQYRGPSPLFWQLKQGVKDFGVSLHKMTDLFDQGDIVAQKQFLLEDGLSIDTINEIIANHAADLLFGTLNDFNGSAFESNPQDQLNASEQSFVKNNDYHVSTDWTAKRIYNFIRAYQNSGQTFLCLIEEEKVTISKVISYQEKPYLIMKGSPYKTEGYNIYFSCQQGYIQAQYISISEALTKHI